ncbi:MAG TPA: Lrp/AsnC family transcriptional regulator [Anaerolineales bacterium]|nr:Lrp/AsnC family transcriptional regulator [Anaerolineales bacterium]
MEEVIDIRPNNTLDEADMIIVKALQKDGRVAFAQIAGQLGVSPGMIRQRYNRMVEQGILKVVAITNPLMLGYKTMAMIGIRVDGKKLLEVAEKISRLDEVIYMVISSGRFDIFAEVVCRDHEDLLRFITKKLSTIDGVRESESFMHLKIVKEIYF